MTRSTPIREYRPDDAPAMARIFHEAVTRLGPRRYSPAQVAAWSPSVPDPAAFAARAADGRITLIATDRADRPLAFGDLEPDGHIDFLYCLPEAAGSGVAGALLDALLARAAARGIIRLNVEASELARSLFERRGFMLVARRDFLLRGVPIHHYRLERPAPDR